MECPVIQPQLVQELEHNMHTTQRHVKLTQVGILPRPSLQEKASADGNGAALNKTL